MNNLNPQPRKPRDVNTPLKDSSTSRLHFKVESAERVGRQLGPL